MTDVLALEPAALPYLSVAALNGGVVCNADYSYPQALAVLVWPFGGYCNEEAALDVPARSTGTPGSATASTHDRYLGTCLAWARERFAAE